VAPKSLIFIPNWLNRSLEKVVLFSFALKHEILKRKANWIGHILRRNCLLQRVTEGKIQRGTEVTGRQGIRRKKLLGDLKERRGYSRLTEEALDRTMWRARFGRGFGPVVRQTAKWMHYKLQVGVRDVSFCCLCQRTLVRRQTRQESLKKGLFTKQKLCLTV
jgi:hypothetical protein